MPRNAKIRISISVKLLIFFFVFSQVGVISIGTYSYFKARKAMISRTFNQLISVRIEKENRLKAFFSESTKDLDKLLRFEETQALFKQLNDSTLPDAISQENFIHTFFHNSDIYECISFYIDDSRHISFPLSEEGKASHVCQFPREFLQKLHAQAQSEDIVLYDNYLDEKDKDIHLIIGKLVPKKDYEVLIVLQIPIHVINDIMLDENPLNGLGKSGEAYLVGKDYLMRSSSRFKDKSILVTKVKTAGVQSAQNGLTGQGIFADYRGIDVLSSYSKVDLPYVDWAIMAEIDFDEAVIPIIQIRNNIVYLTIIISLLMLGIVALISVAFTRPIKALQKETEKIAKGEYGKTIQLESNDELGDLIHAFNSMTMQLKEQSDKLEKERNLRLTSMIDGQEMERQRLSRELHDSIAQHLLAIKMQLENALDAPDKEGREIINNAIESFKLTTQEIRYISNNLRPAVLSEFGLVTALQNLLRNYKSSFNLDYELKSDIEDKLLSSRQETYLFRVCQEALQNIAKYAEATFVKIQVSLAPGSLTLIISDNGKGFILSEEKLSKGNGLTNMKERTQLLNGQFKIESKPKKGTDIVVTIPFKPKAQP